MRAVNKYNFALPEIVKFRESSESESPTIFTDIYRDDINMVIWRRPLAPELRLSIHELLKSHNALQVVSTVTLSNASATLRKLSGFNDDHGLLSEDMAELVNMFCCLFDLKQVGLRLTSLNRAMCPRFHVDKIPCRLVTTYQGVGTEWLPHHIVNREKLGVGNQGLSDEDSGLFQSKMDIRQINSGDVALLKGELWEGNENAGLVHRSPVVLSGESRLLLTLDFVY